MVRLQVFQQKLHYGYNILCEVRDKIYPRFDACITNLDHYLSAYGDWIIISRSSKYIAIASLNPDNAQDLTYQLTEYIQNNYFEAPKFITYATKQYIHQTNIDIIMSNIQLISVRKK